MDGTGALDSLIAAFEVSLPDEHFPRLVAQLGQCARDRAVGSVEWEANAAYFYLLGRVYELLGYCARHTPWLSNSPKFYWQRSVGFFEQAMLYAPVNSSHRAFLHGKLLFRAAMTHTIDAARGVFAGSLENLTEAATRFDEAASQTADTQLRFIYRDASVVAATENRHRSLRYELKTLIDQAPTGPWPAIFEAIREKTLSFNAQTFSGLPPSAAGTGTTQHALSEARKLFIEARVLQMFTKFLRSVPQQYASLVQQSVESTERLIVDAYERSAKICEAAGLTVRAGHTRVTLLRHRADAALRDSIHQFAAARASDASEGEALLQHTGTPPVVAPPQVIGLLQVIDFDSGRVRAADDLLGVLREMDIVIADHAVILRESATTWILSDTVARLLLRATDGQIHIIDLTKQPIAFNHEDAARFNDYATRILNTCELYTSAIREINRALSDATDLYERIADQLQSDASRIQDDDLADLHMMTRSVLYELRSRHYPLLATLRERTRYAWSLLEMFQMRNGSVRLATLFSAQCRLVMRNPFYDATMDRPDDEFLEVGADPIFKTTIEFIMRGAQGEEDRHEFQRRALKATLATIAQQEQNLITELRFVEVDAQTRTGLMARLACHRNLAMALQEFTHVFVVQKPLEMRTVTIEKHIALFTKYLNDARSYLDVSAEQQSPLIDRLALDALELYMRGVSRILVGMNQHHGGESRWANTYHSAINDLKDARKQLADVGDVALMPRGAIREEYLNYIDARLLTVSGYRALYRAQESGGLNDFRQAVEFFESSAKLFGDVLRDYRVATKALARAADVQSSVAALEKKPRGDRYRLLKQANALYAACGDEVGFEATWQRLQEDFPFEEGGGVAAERSRSVDADLPPPPPPPHVTFFGPYEVDLLDKGGMAVVYRATRDGRVVALKRVHDKFIDDQELLDRFIREVAIHRTLDHPNIVKIFDSGDVGGVPYFTMELLKGTTLKKYAEVTGPVTPAIVVRIAEQIAGALSYAHGRGVIHRDVKPSNVMLVGDAFVKVLDFGIALTDRFSRLTKVGLFVGTEDYASPERLMTDDASPSTDLYALGLVLYELLTGRRALHWAKRVREDHPRVSMVLPDTPAALDEIVAKLISRDAALGYASAELLLSDLRQLNGIAWSGHRPWVDLSAAP